MNQFGRQQGYQQTTTSYTKLEKPTYLTKYEQFVSSLIPKPYSVPENPSETKTKNKSKISPPPELTPLGTKTNKKQQSDAVSLKAPQSNPISNSPRIKRKRSHRNNDIELQSVTPPKPAPPETADIPAEKLVTIRNDETMRAYECEICSFETIYESSFKEHMLTHKETKRETIHKCPKCSFKIKCKAKIKKHMVMDNQSSFKVVYCGLYWYSYECKVDLEEHLAEHQDDGTQHTFEHSYKST